MERGKKAFEAREIGTVARALLATKEAAIERGDLIALVTDLFGRPHRFYVYSTLKKGDLAKALGLKGKALLASAYGLHNFTRDDDESLSYAGAPMQPIVDAGEELQLAAGAQAASSPRRTSR